MARWARVGGEPARDVCANCDVTFKQFLTAHEGNRVEAAVEASRTRTQARLAAGRVTPEQVEETSRALTASHKELVELQKTQAWAHASGLISPEEALSLYTIYGGDAPSPQKWMRLPLSERAAGLDLGQQLLAARIRRGG